MSEQVFVLTAFGGDRPYAVIREAEKVGDVPGYGVLRKIGDDIMPVRDRDVFQTRDEAAAEAKDRLRGWLSEVSSRYAGRIAELESARGA